MSAFTEQRVTIESDGLRLEGALHAGGRALQAVVLHPHPQYGGDMDNHVVVTLCRTLAEAGVATLRFNFRGAGASQGTFDGRAEAHDAIAACEYLRSRKPDAPLVLAGYSFGAGIAAAVSADVEPTGMLLVSPPPQMMPARLPAGVSTLIVTGGRDPIAPAAPLRALETERHSLVVVEAVDHGWWPGIDHLADAVREFVGNLLAEQ
jgi:alpha/beta superfamily hydrolase